jgi:hypothetical protein
MNYDEKKLVPEGQFFKSLFSKGRFRGIIRPLLIPPPPLYKRGGITRIYMSD